MITTPAICRLRKLGCPVTAKVKIAPTAFRARQLAFLLCLPSDGDSGSAGSRFPPGSAACITPAGTALHPRPFSRRPSLPALPVLEPAAVFARAGPAPGTARAAGRCQGLLLGKGVSGSSPARDGKDQAHGEERRAGGLPAQTRPAPQRRAVGQRAPPGHPADVRGAEA